MFSKIVEYYNNKDLILVNTSDYLLMLEPGSGEAVVNHPISHSRENHTIPPIYENNKLFYASGYDEGETLFKNRDFGRGCIILADDKFYLYSNKGEVALCLPAKTEIELISQFQIPAGKATFAFAYPVIYDGKTLHPVQ